MSFSQIDFSRIGIGCYTLSGVYGRKDVREFSGMIQRAFDLGVNFFDTAETYGPGEEILGEAVRPFRDQVFLASKVGMRAGSKPDLSPENVRQACESSLKRLGTDWIDLYQIHFDDPSTPVQETLAALEKLAADGKIRRYGLGHLPLARVKEYTSSGNPYSVLLEFSAVARDAQKEIIPYCRDHNLAVIAFSITGRGLLTGRFQDASQFEDGDIRLIDPLFQRERLEHGLRVAEKFRAVGRRYNASPVQVAIAWVIAQPGITCALTGPSTISHLEENLASLKLNLSQEDVAEMDDFLNQEEISLRKAQRLAVDTILRKPTNQDPEQAFKNLVYLIETAITLEMADEQQIMPLFLSLYELRSKLDKNSLPSIAVIHRQLREILES